MNIKLKLLFAILMITALSFGFIDIYFPSDNYSFERLHIFLFNLCTGGTILLYFTSGQTKVSKDIAIFFISSLVYAFSAFFEFYPLTILVSILLFTLVEKIRIKKFSLFPSGFFRSDESVAQKFHQASLLCLSIGIAMASLVILNNEYFKLITMKMLTLNTFFLGFSFPLSLITLFLVFSMLKTIEKSSAKIIMEICFWAITLGVIIFFIFILFEKFIPQIFVTAALFTAVLIVFMLYTKFAENIQQKLFLTSGIGFLIFTAITGIAYIVIQMGDGYDPQKTKWLMQMHVFASLYGWNLCGLAIICRYDDFPITMHSLTLIGIHWVTAIVLAPLGIFYPLFAILAVIGYTFIVLTLFFSKNMIAIKER
ncbi:hypothetical protein KAJ27_10790 [bacterium]|nr:hypothetical protein [bacterium]